MKFLARRARCCCWCCCSTACGSATAACAKSRGCARRSSAAAQENARAARAQPHARGRSAGPEEGHDGDRGARAHRPRHGRQERNVLPGRVAEDARAGSSRAATAAPAESRRRERTPQRRSQSAAANAGSSCPAAGSVAAHGRATRAEAVPAARRPHRDRMVARAVPGARATASASWSCSRADDRRWRELRVARDPKIADRDRRRGARRLGARRARGACRDARGARLGAGARRCATVSARRRISSA